MDGVERLQVVVNGLAFDVLAAGAGRARPVILLHGFPQSSSAWRPILVALGQHGYHALAPDQRGYSPAARPSPVAEYAVPRLVGDVLALADTMEIPRFDLVGHDWGGMVAWVLAARHAERVRSLTVVSTPHPEALRSAARPGDVGRPDGATSIDVFRRPAEPERLLLGEAGDGSGLRDLLASTGLGAAAAHSYVADMLQPGALTAALNWYRAMDAADIAVLPPIVVPTLYVWSTEDPALGRRAAESTVEWVAGRYQFEVLEGVGHWVPEQAADVLGRLLLDHLAST